MKERDRQGGIDPAAYDVFVGLEWKSETCRSELRMEKQPSANGCPMIGKVCTINWTSITVGNESPSPMKPEGPDSGCMMDSNRTARPVWWPLRR
jgi:hypothetical protein